MLTSIAADNYAVEVEVSDFAYCLHGVDGVRVATFREGRIGHREWAIRRVDWRITKSTVLMIDMTTMSMKQ